MTDNRPRISSDEANISRTVAPNVSNGGSKRITEPSLGKRISKRIDSFREEEKEKVIITEERLASGARIVIESKGPSDTAVFSS